jgi:hypothetical protein
MPVSGYTIGQDVKLTIIVPNFGPVVFSKIISFTSNPTTTEKTIQPMNDNPKILVFHEGWTGTIEGERNDDSVDSYWSRVETAYYAGEDVLGGTITQTIKEKDNTVSRYLYTAVQFRLEDAGMFKGNDSVPWRLSFTGSRRLKVL